MNSATIVFAFATIVASAWGSVTPIVVQQQEASPSVVQPIAANIPIADLYRSAYRQAYIAAPEDQKSASSEVAASGLIQGQDGVIRAINYAVPLNYQTQALVHPVAIGPRILGPSISLSPAARGFALGGLTGLGLGLGARSLIAGVPLGLGVHSALSTPALGIGLGASAAALLG